VSQEERFGIWFNKRALRLIELPFRHESRSKNGGWEVVARAPGRLVARFLNGEHQRFELEAGDTLSGSGEEIYLSLDRQSAEDPSSDQPAGGPHHRGDKPHPGRDEPGRRGGHQAGTEEE